MGQDFLIYVCFVEIMNLLLLILLLEVILLCRNGVHRCNDVMQNKFSIIIFFLFSFSCKSLFSRSKYTQMEYASIYERPPY